MYGLSARIWCKISFLQHDVRGYLTRNWRENHLNYNGVKKWEYRDFLGNLRIFWELTWDFYKITVGNAGCGPEAAIFVASKMAATIEESNWKT